MKYDNLIENFFKIFGNPEKMPELFFAPGRVNLIGEHTDYNGGYVLPCALNIGTYLVIRKTGDNFMKMRSLNFDYSADIPLEKITEKDDNKWVNYPLGIMDQLLKKGIEFTGLEMLFSGNIPNGSGLSSSASVEMVTATALNELFFAGLDKIELIKLSQKAENTFVGVNCGIMDQFAVGMGKKDNALFLDCATLNYEYAPLKLKDCSLIIANTNKKRGLADSKYNERVAECSIAVDYLKQKFNINLLGELSYRQFEQSEDLIQDITVRKRARHVVSENDRVIKAVAALRNANLKLFGKLMNDSHDSLRNDYEVTGKELDAMVEEARKINGVLGARMTGAGFGGCTVNLVKKNIVKIFIEILGEKYFQRTGLRADFYLTETGNGARRINL